MLKLLTAKDVSNICECSLSTAYRIMKEIKKEFKIKRITLHHLNIYLS